MDWSARIALVGDYDRSVTAHRAIPQALGLASANSGVDLSWDWVATSDIQSQADLTGYAAIWCVPASPYANPHGALTAIRYARETGTPFLGTCGGYQHAVLDYARNVLGHDAAGTLEEDPACQMPVIGTLVCALRDTTGTIRLEAGSRLAQICGATEIEEGYSCGYGVNPEYLGLFQGTDLAFTGFDPEGDPRAFELSGHPFFLGTAFQPERAALRDRAHPLVGAFVNSAIHRVQRAA